MISESQTRYGSVRSPRRARHGSTRACRSYQARRAWELILALTPRTERSLPPCGGGLGRGAFLLRTCFLPPTRLAPLAGAPLAGGGEERDGGGAERPRRGEAAPLFFCRFARAAGFMAATRAGLAPE